MTVDDALTATAYAYLESDRYKEARAWVDGQGALPPAEVLAAPLVQALHGLWAVFEDRAQVMLFGLEAGVFQEEADALIATAHQVAAHVALTVVGRVSHCNGSASIAEAARSVVLAITDVASAEQERYHALNDRIVYGD